MAYPSTLELRSAAESDLVAIFDLLMTNGLPVEGVEKHLAGFILALDGSALAGCAGLEAHGQAGLLRSLAVVEDKRSTGLGKQLVRAVLDEARRLGLTSVSLLTTTAAAYFPRFGFEELGRAQLPPSLKASEELGGACPDTATAMTLHLKEV